jgi:hypothetical protein
VGVQNTVLGLPIISPFTILPPSPSSMPSIAPKMKYRHASLSAMSFYRQNPYKSFAKSWSACAVPTTNHEASITAIVTTVLMLLPPLQITQKRFVETFVSGSLTRKIPAYISSADL